MTPVFTGFGSIGMDSQRFGSAAIGKCIIDQQSFSGQDSVILKLLSNILILPVTIRVVNYIKKVEGTDIYDTNTSYNILKIKEL